MHAVRRRQYEMLMRIRDFGDAHRQLFAGSTTARANRKAAARKALIAVLVKVSKLARVLAARGYPIPPFRRPASKSDHVLLTLTRQFARDAAACAEFDRHGIGATCITEAADAFAAATSDRSMKRADTIAARARIRQLLTSAASDARRLDFIVHFMVTDDGLRAVWMRARRRIRAAGGATS